MAVAAVRIAITDNTSLSGTGPMQGVALTAGVDVVGVFRETPSADSGIYVVQAGAWQRHADYDTEADFPPDGMTFFVREGAHRRRNFQFKNEATPPTLGLTLLNFKPVDLAEAPRSTGTITVDSATGGVAQADMGVTPGTYPNLTATITAEGNVVGAYGAGTGSTFIEGLKVIWNSTTSITVKAGAAWVPGLNKVVELFEDKVFSGLSLTADTWYYPYLFEPTAGVGDVELVTTAPAAPYRGDARSKSGDTSRRFLRPAIRAGTAGAIRRFEVMPDGLIRYQEDVTAAPYLVLSDGRSATYANVSCSAIVPPTSTQALARLKHESSSGSVNISLPALSVPIDLLNSVASSGQRLEKNTPLALNSSQQFSYSYAGASVGATNGLYVNILGYWEAG